MPHGCFPAIFGRNMHTTLCPFSVINRGICMLKAVCPIKNKHALQTVWARILTLRWCVYVCPPISCQICSLFHFGGILASRTWMEPFCYKNRPGEGREWETVQNIGPMIKNTNDLKTCCYYNTLIGNHVWEV